ncbi:preprotein translocase subunit SecE [Chondromyces crocatus]|uniref:Protein translocase subunit SecE n=1 Tax=Chondromyces crocatus TaxID=52 RepID=A0A0K1E938_CHOCO|nr:preprotein translocase subunit SecE [Chondromyces crocatus]AKT37401.1 uncharacterized protein CMC5_015420 [Chondromyces crocatus]
MAKGKKSENAPEGDEPVDREEDLSDAEQETALAVHENDAKRSAIAQGGTEEVVAPGEEDDEDDESDGAAAQLGIDKYVFAAFFVAGMLFAYLIGRLVHGVWATAASTAWFSRAVPVLANVADEQKTTYGVVIGGIIALILVLRMYRNPEIRTWADEVATELTKVKWPTKKDVTNATFIVITATTVATIYLTLLDRFWAFVTSIVYGDGS